MRGVISPSGIRSVMHTCEILPGVVITDDRCVLLDEGCTAAIGDLHLGYERALEDEGLYLPRINTGTIRDALNGIIGRYEPERIVLLGDIKHDFRRSQSEPAREIREIIGLISEAAEAVLVRGNHDNYIQNILAGMGVDAVSSVDIAGFRLEHGHVDSGIRPVIIGHEHPAVRIPGPNGMKLQCFVLARKEGVLVVPPFSPMSPGNDLLSEDAVMAPALQKCDLGKAEIYGVSELGIFPLGDLSGLADMEMR